MRDGSARQLREPLILILPQVFASYEPPTFIINDNL
jgi:hypothetical protein